MGPHGPCDEAVHASPKLPPHSLALLRGVVVALFFFYEMTRSMGLLARQHDGCAGCLGKGTIEALSYLICWVALLAGHERRVYMDKS